MLFRSLDIAQDMQAGGNVNPAYLAAVSVSQEAIRGSIDADASWAPDLIEVAYGEYGYLAWSADPLLIDLDRVSPLRALGRGGTLALIDEIAVRTADPEDIERVLDTSAGVHPSLMDNPDFSTAAIELERRGVHTAELTPSSVQDNASAANAADAETRARIARLPALPSYRLLGLGESIEANGDTYATFVYITGSRADAEWLAQVTSAIFVSELAQAGSIREIQSDGNVAIVVVERSFSLEGRKQWRESLYLLL